MRTRKIVALAVTSCLSVALLSACSSSATSDSSSSQSSTVSDTELVLDESYQNLVIDIRSPEQYATGHVEGAVNVPYEETDFFNNILVTLGKGEFYIVYGDEKVSADKAVESFEQIELKAEAYRTVQEASDATALPIVK